MKILYLISVHGHGSGGHFHSLNHISHELGKENIVQIISIGPGFSPVISGNSFFEEHVLFNGLNVFSVYRKLKEKVQDFNPDILHCFDIGSYNIIRLFFNPKEYRIVVNKCGGPNPKKFSFVPNLILFSIENFEWFSNNNKFRQTRMDTIPNRVRALKLDGSFKPVKKNDSFTFVRICRIGSFHYKSIEDSIRLIEKLLDQDFSVMLIIIGAIEDEYIYKKIQKNELVKKKKVTFLTQNKYTQEASKMLYLADAVIGTGRGLMEAASLKKPLLGINSRGSVPCIIDADTFFDAFKTNFSERNTFNDKHIDNDFDKITKMIGNVDYYNELSNFSDSVFSKYFDIEQSADLYLNFYKNCQYGNNKLKDDFLIVLRNFRHFYKSYLKIKKNA